MIGLHLSQYRIDAELGRGGMGIVYRATDTKLNRSVALKILPSAVLGNEDDRARFFREAQAAAQLHHPNIATVFGIDEAAPLNDDGRAVEGQTEKRPFIAMELIEGETLHARIGKGPLKLGDVVAIARQVAEALKAAHAKEIVHRDIKSANVMLTGDGTAKVLDFGLAKTQASTMLTRQGSTLGTVAYMSPEQARGEEVDARSDLYSLGTVIYEMTAGRLPFVGDYEQAILYGILNELPEPLTAVRTGVPMALEQIVDKCLEKDRSMRYASAQDLIVDLRRLEATLDGASATSRSRSSMPAMSAARPGVVASPEPARSSVPVWVWPVVVLAAVSVGWIASSFLMGSPAERTVEKLTLHINGVRDIKSPALSPNHDYIAFGGTDTTGWEGLFLYDVRTGEVKRIQRSDRGFYPWFSPSGDRLAYAVTSEEAAANGTYYDETFVVDVPTGAPRRVGPGWTSYWEDEDHILTSIQPGVWRFNVDSGDRSLVYEPDSAFADYWIFPGPVVEGTRVELANMQRQGQVDNDPRFVAIDLDSGTGTIGDPGMINLQGIGRGIVVYQVGDDRGPLVARRFDPDSRRFVSAPVPVVETMHFGYFHATSDGSLLMAPRLAERLSRLRGLSVVDTREGSVRSIPLENARDRSFTTARISPDGRTVLLRSWSSRLQSGHIVRVELRTGASAQQTPEADIAFPRWLGDGNAFVATLGPIEEEILVRYPVVGSGVADTMTAPVLGLVFGGETVQGWVVTSRESDEADSRVGILDLGTRTIRALPGQSGESSGPVVAPGGRLVAFLDRTGNSRRIVVQDVVSGAREEVLADASDVQWAPEGDYLYYFEFDNVYRLPISIQGGFTVRGEREFVLQAESDASYSVGPEGRIVLLTTRLSFSEERENYDVIEWWRNYDVELDKQLDGK